MSVTIPTMVFDDFFQNPDEVRKFALKQQYFVSDEGIWPGLRSNPLSEINKELFHYVVVKIISLMYNTNTQYQYTVDARFQVITGEYGEGWVHHDAAISLLTAIIYLTPESTSGTSIYKINNPLTFNPYEYQKEKVLSINTKNGTQVPARDLHNSKFAETIKISGEYNRMLVFDSHLCHAAHHFFGTSNEDARLTLVIFIQQLNATDMMPAVRANRHRNGI